MVLQRKRTRSLLISEVKRLIDTSRRSFRCKAFLKPFWFRKSQTLRSDVFLKKPACWSSLNFWIAGPASTYMATV